MTLIKYDVDIDLKILKTIFDSKNGIVNMSDLRHLLGLYQSRLEEHLDYLQKWKMIQDKKPQGPGKAREISIDETTTYGECILSLTHLKTAIGLVNEYFD